MTRRRMTRVFVFLITGFILSARSTVAAPYSSAVLADSPAVYYRFEERLNESPPAKDIALNFGSLGAAGNGLNGEGVLHPAPGAITGSLDSANAYRPKGTRGGTTTLVPWSAALNPSATLPFTVEAWFYVSQEVTDALGPSPLMNRYSYPGADRQGWVYFQRSPTTGWNFRTYTGTGSATGVDITGQASTPGAGRVGSWNHVVTTWDGTTATLYVNGQEVAKGTGGYAPNTDDHDPNQAVNGPAGLGIGSYNNTQPGENSYTGRVDEVAIYPEVLSAERILAHYQIATNVNRAHSYEAEVLLNHPVEFLRFQEPAFNPAHNSGSSSTSLDGSVVFARQSAPGPAAPSFPGMGDGNQALLLDGINGFVNIGNPQSPTLGTPIAVEAWIRPNTSQGPVANIIARSTIYSDEDDLFLRIVDGNSYEFGTLVILGEETSFHGVKANASAADLSGSTWTHLVGTFDGSAWNLYRNGILAGSSADNIGFGVGFDTDWSIGSRGDGIGHLFAGAIDEVAVYPRALSAAQVQAHFQAALVAVTPPVPLSVSRDGNQIKISWTGPGILQSSATINGNYTDVPGAVSPAFISTNDAAGFYRLR